jgi:hypothetical protein
VRPIRFPGKVPARKATDVPSFLPQSGSEQHSAYRHYT